MTLSHTRRAVSSGLRYNLSFSLPPGDLQTVLLVDNDVFRPQSGQRQHPPRGWVITLFRVTEQEVFADVAGDPWVAGQNVVTGSAKLSSVCSSGSELFSIGAPSR